MITYTQLAWWIGGILLSTPLCWLAGDYLYARRIERRLRHSEPHISRDADGIRRGCRDYLVGRGDAALLLIHGFGDSPAVFTPLASSLAGRGFACRAMRLPGFCAGMEEAANVTVEAWMRAIHQEIRALRLRYSSVWIVAHSLGCALAAEHVTRRPNEVDGLIFIAPLVKVSRKRSPILPPRWWFRLGTRFLRHTRVFENTLPRDTRTREAKAFDYRDRFIHMSIYRGLFEAADRMASAASGLTLPLMTIISERDCVIDSRAAVQFMEQCVSPRKKLRVVRHAGHVIPLEPGWDDLAEDIAGFINAPALERPQAKARPSPAFHGEPVLASGAT